MTLGRLFLYSPPELGGARGGLNKGTLWLFRPPLTPPNLGGEKVTFEATFSD